MVLFKCPHSHQAGVIVNLSWITIQTPSRSRKWKMKNEPQWANSSSSSLPLFIHDEDNISSSHVVSRTDDCGWPLSVTILDKVSAWVGFVVTLPIDCKTVGAEAEDNGGDGPDVAQAQLGRNHIAHGNLQQLRTNNNERPGEKYIKQTSRLDWHQQVFLLWRFSSFPFFLNPWAASEEDISESYHLKMI